MDSIKLLVLAYSRNQSEKIKCNISQKSIGKGVRIAKDYFNYNERLKGKKEGKKESKSGFL